MLSASNWSHEARKPGLAELQRATVECTWSAIAWYEYGEYLLQEDDPQLAEALAAAVRLNPVNVDALYLLGRALVEVDD